MKSFFSPEAKGRVRAAVAGVEQQSSAEIVVALRHRSGHYRHADYAAGGVAALAALSAFLYHPEPFDFTFLPLELLAIFGVIAAATAHVPPLRRLLCGARLRDENVRCAARAFFVDHGLSRTTGRTAILIYLSSFERRAEVVSDIGVDEEALGAPWKEAKQRLEEAFAAGAFEGFLGALGALGPALASGLPRAADDVNELPDEVA